MPMTEAITSHGWEGDAPAGLRSGAALKRVGGRRVRGAGAKMQAR